MEKVKVYECYDCKKAFVSVKKCEECKVFLCSECYKHERGGLCNDCKCLKDRNI